MSSDNELTPQQEFEKILSSAAVDIARMEQVRDAPGRPGSPAPKPEPPPGSPSSTGARPPADRVFQDNAIANRKAETLQKVEQIAKKVSPEQKKEMQKRTYSTLYPNDKKDLNQIPRNKDDARKNGDKEVDNAQERANFLRGKQASKDQGGKKDTEIDKSQDRAEKLRLKGKNKDDPAAVKSDGKNQENKSNKEQPKSMSAQFKQSLEGNKGQAKDAKNPSQGKSMSMGARFTQSIGHNQSSPSPTVKSGPSPSAPGSGGGGSKGSGSSPGGRGN